MSDISARRHLPFRTKRAMDVTGAENVLLLLSNPGDEIAYAGFIAELCARGRPPFVAILADGALNGDDALANARERESRAALTILGMPEDRVLFVGLRMGALPLENEALFDTLKAAMAILSWRKDCNVIAAALSDKTSGDGVSTWQIAGAIARDNALPMVAGVSQFASHGERIADYWDLDVSALSRVCDAAAEVHSRTGREIERADGACERFLRFMAG